jgi:hypothetical protein
MDAMLKMLPRRALSKGVAALTQRKTPFKHTSMSLFQSSSEMDSKVFFRPDQPLLIQPTWRDFTGARQQGFDRSRLRDVHRQRVGLQARELLLQGVDKLASSLVVATGNDEFSPHFGEGIADLPTQ